VRELLPTIPRADYSYRSDSTVPSFPDDKPLVVFDGYCGLCARLAQFVLHHDHAGEFRLMPAQTALGDALYRHYGLDPSFYETFILLRHGRAYFVSDAAIELLKTFEFPWSIAPAMRFVPKVVRDWTYLRIAHNRMRFFGRTTSCFAPAPEMADRFVDGGARPVDFEKA